MKQDLAGRGDESPLVVELFDPDRHDAAKLTCSIVELERSSFSDDVAANVYEHHDLALSGRALTGHK